MGPQAEDVFQTFNLSDEQTRDFDYVLGKFENYFLPRRNVIYERVIFNSRIQGDSESADDFATALYKLAETCEYALKDDLMRDRFVVGLRDKRLSEKLQLDSALTWEKALTTARQNEAEKQQQAEIHPVTDSTEVGHVATKRVGRRSHPAQREQQQQSTPVNGKRTMIKQRTCGWSGRLRHLRNSCPARNVTCNKCHKGGPFAAVCRSEKRASAIQGFVGVATSTSSSKWDLDVLVNGISLPFRIDTGADESVLTETVFNEHFPGLKLRQSLRTLCGPDGKPLNVVGMATLQLICKNLFKN
ncbi:uncharacterized protein LOC135398390 [Ornithodoros turicata]|uniref:uncharacterized protein LOC135398390 n=1 Tax=Ornithodoros turicata TaxID=34597 RepID=UPI00313A1F7C